MKRAPMALLPLLFVALLTGLTYWLERATTGNEIARRSASRHDPDFIVEHFSVQRFNESGTLVNAVKAEKMTHYPDDNSADVIEPVMDYYRKEAPTKLSARTAHIIRDGEEVQLHGSVRLMRPAGASPALLMQSESMTVYPETEKALSRSPVTITQGKSVVHGSGMEYDGKERTAVMSGRVTSTFNKDKK